MRVRSHRVQQATGYPGTAAAAVTRLMVVTVFMIVTVTMLVVVTVRVAVIVVRAARAVHVDQNARENALPHINTYQGRALAN
jgi:heme/copper-type cytochrome/quinol oxidase subunit 2